MSDQQQTKMGGSSADFRWRERTDEEYVALYAENVRRTMEAIVAMEKEEQR